MGEELRVDTNDLRGKADEINGLRWATPGQEPPITPPSALSTSVDAAANLAKMARSVWLYQNWGFTEGKRLAESLYHVGKAYDEVDLRAKGEIAAGKPISNGPVKPDDCSIPAPPHPSPPEAPGQVGKASGDPEDVENALKNGDQGAALRAAANFWRSTGNDLQTAAEPFQVRIQNWEGAAAEAAYGRFNDFGGWLHSLAGTWQQLAAEADKVADAHDKARAEHTPIYDQWMALKKQLETAPDDQKTGIMANLAKLYADSEHVRAQYATAATIDRVQPPEPRDGAGPSIPVTTNGDPRQPAVPAGEEGKEGGPQQPGAGGGGQAGAGGGAPQGGAPSPMAAPVGQTAAPQQATPSGGSPAGGAPSGSGSPAGGGKPGGSPGGGLPGGMPAAAKAAANLPKGPNLKPAGTGGGGAGHGGGGGGAGGGPHPLQPAVAGTAVAASHGAAESAADAAKTAAGGAAGGAGMGGMPMGGHGSHGQGGKERRRTPGLSPDEELYKEDRSWTEGVIGARRRKEAPDSKESK